MWNNSRTRKTRIILVCVLVVGLAFFGSVIGSQVANASTASSSHARVVSSTHEVRANASTFSVTSIDMSVTPNTVSLWTCGSFIQVVYNAVFHVNSGPNGGTIEFSYTVNNGRSQTPEKLTILPGQHLSNFTFTWQGSLPADHTFPEPGGVMVTSPNALTSQLVSPAGQCR